jgi:hypothetical protein
MGLMAARRLMLGTLVMVCALGYALGLSVASGSAAVTHEYLAGLSTTISKGIPESTAVGAMTGDSGHLWFGERFQGVSPATTRVAEFDASSGQLLGSPLVQEGSVSYIGELGVAVGHLTGEEKVYVNGGQKGSVVAVYDASRKLQGVWTGASTPTGSFEGLSGVAVDGSAGLGDWAAGDVYVSTEPGSERNAVDVFRPEASGQEPASLAARLTGTCSAPGTTCSGSEVVPFKEPTGVAVSGFNGDVLVADGNSEGCRKGTEECVVDVFEPVSGMPGVYSFLFKITGTPNGPFLFTGPVAVDGVNGDIYITEAPEAHGSKVVDEFDAAGRYRGQLTGVPTGSSGEVRPFRRIDSVAIDPVSDHLFVAEYDETTKVSDVDAFGPDLAVPDVTTGPATGVRIREGNIEATLTGTVNPDGEGEASCAFAWGTTKEFGETAKCEPEKVANGESPVAVHATLDASNGAVLAPDTTYYYRLQASNQHGTDPGEPSQDMQFTTPGPGLIEESASDIASSSVTLNATISPHGRPTSYYFQFGTSTAYGGEAPLAPGVSLGSGETALEVSQHVQGLTEGTVYHYRVVAVSELEPGVFKTFVEPDRVFRTQSVAHGSGLPDGRSWEMVSPPVKHGALILPIGPSTWLTQAAAGGNAISYLAASPTEEEAPANENVLNAPVFSGRTASGWVSRDIAPAHETAAGVGVGIGSEYRAFSEDLSLAVVNPFGPFIPSSSPLALAPGEASEQTAFLRTDYTGGNVGQLCTRSCYKPLVTGMAGFANVAPGTVFGEQCSARICGPLFVGASGDLSHIVLRSTVPLLTGANSENLYEWSSGRLALVSVLPGGEPAPAGSVSLGFEGKVTRNAVSDGGNRVVWTTSERSGEGHLYLRDMSRSETVQGKTVQGETVQIDVVQGGSGKGVNAPRFQFASTDGSKVFFTDTQHLRADSGIAGEDLYECVIVEEAGKLACELSDLTPASSSVQAADVRGTVIGASSDGSWVYFVANGVLAEGAAQGDCDGTQNGGPSCNLYVWHDGVTRFIARLANQDLSDWAGFGVGELTQMTARVSPDGEWLAFMSQRELTGASTRDAVSGEPDEQVYLYHAAGAGSLVCASCNPTGARPIGVKSEYRWESANVPGWTPTEGGTSHYQSRYLSDSGRLFFNSTDALIPQDVNGNVDVYEYEPPGVGDCTSANPGFSEGSYGCVGLISSGGAPGESTFLDASETGGDVFFLTLGKLSGADFDTAPDVYDAHECRSDSPCFAPPVAVPPPCDTGDSCKAVPTPQPTIFGAPASGTFAGQGNVTANSSTTVRQRGLSRAQKLRRALAICHRKKHRRRRVACERSARARYAHSSHRAKAGKGGRA